MIGLIYIHTGDKDVEYYVYMMTNRHRKVLYAGMTNDLTRRVYEHQNHLIPGFTAKYNVDMLVYFEQTGDVNAAIAREKQIKGWSRAKKNVLVESMNPDWADLAKDWV